MCWGTRTLGCFSLSDTSTLRAEGLMKGGSSPRPPLFASYDVEPLPHNPGQGWSEPRTHWYYIQGIPPSYKWGLGIWREPPSLGCTHLGNRWLGAGLDMLIKWPVPPGKVALDKTLTRGWRERLGVALPCWEETRGCRPQFRYRRLLQFVLSFSRFFWINVSSFAICPKDYFQRFLCDWVYF